METLQENNIDSFTDESKIKDVVRSQKDFFDTGATRDIEWRIAQIKKLETALRNHEKDVYEALRLDLNKSDFETYASELGFLYFEIKKQLKNIKKWTKTQKISGEIVAFPGKPRIYAEPYGCTLIMAPWNYPFLLTLQPLLAAMTAGNTAVVKPSEISENSARVIKQIISETFDSNYICVIDGGLTQNQSLLREKFDFIFFTGSPSVGKIVMESAARNLTPVCLELGGKSPCIIDSSANIHLAARRIIWGKMFNAGQTCVAPDYVLVHESVKDNFIEELNSELKKQYGENVLENENYPKIINKKHFNRLLSVAPQAAMDVESNKIGPLFLDLGAVSQDLAKNHPSMQEELFGPILPVISYSDLNEAITFIKSKSSPLSLYIFSEIKEVQERIISSIRFGGGCINDTVIHLSCSNAPFGGIGTSGIGQYHGKYGFDTFTHYKTVLVQSTKMDISLRYAPHKKKLGILKKFFH